MRRHAVYMTVGVAVFLSADVFGADEMFRDFLHWTAGIMFGFGWCLRETMLAEQNKDGTGKCDSGV